MPKWVEIDKKAMAFGWSFHGKKNRFFWVFSHGCLIKNLYREAVLKYFLITESACNLFYFSVLGLFS